MQGQWHSQEKTYLQFSLSARVPAHNFYRRLKEVLNWEFLYEATKPYYGKCGHQSIDPVIFFKLVLVGYLENIASDRRLIEHCWMRLDILYFLGYNLDDPLPWHSTISRTRQLLGKEVFDTLFNRVFDLCVEKGMVSGHTQCVDSALIKANASLDSLLEKQPAAATPQPLPTLPNPASSTDRLGENPPKRPSKVDRSRQEQRVLTAPKFELQELKARQKHWRETQTGTPGDKLERARYLSNLTHYSPTDPQARIAVKPGKPRQLCYLASTAVDKAQGVISHIQADSADQKDNQCLISVVDALQQRLEHHRLRLQTLVADTAYSSGENYQYLEHKKITAYIPVHGSFAVEREGFTYDAERDCFICPQGKRLHMSRFYSDRNYYRKKTYQASRKDCGVCAIRTQCISAKTKEKKFDVTYFYSHYQRAYQRQVSPRGHYYKKLRQSKVEPVLGTLINFLALRRIHTRGLATAHKVMLLAATAFNLKKLLRFNKKQDLAFAKALSIPLTYFSLMYLLLPAMQPKSY